MDFSKFPGLSLKDTTGAGDSFTSAFGLRLAETRNATGKSSLETKELVECLEFASAAAFLTISKMGAAPALPSREEVDALVELSRHQSEQQKW